MKTPESFKEAFAESGTVKDVLKRMGMSSTHTKVRAMDATYASRVEELLDAGLLSKQTRKDQKSALENLMASLDRAEFTQLTLPFPQEEIPRKSIEQVVEAIDEVMPVIFIDEDGEAVTIKEAMKSPDLMAQAVRKTHARAAKARALSDRENWCYVAVTDVAARLAEQNKEHEFESA